MNDLTDHDLVVLAGGAARRLGGADKPALSVGGRPLLDRVLAACPDAATTVLVGPARPTTRAVVHALEDPPGGGPLAALDAGLRHTTAPTVLVLSADLPFLTAATVRALLAAMRTTVAAGPGGTPAPPDGAMLRDAAGRDQPLVAAYRAEPLRRALARIRAAHGSLAGLRCARCWPSWCSNGSRTPPPRPPSTATPGKTSARHAPVSGSMGTCWTNGSPQSRPNWASNSMSTRRRFSISRGTRPMAWPAPPRR